MGCSLTTSAATATAPTSSWKLCSDLGRLHQGRAIVQDKATGLFAKAEKVHRLDYQGHYFRSRGPFTVPRSAQGHPVIIQAGQSGRGQRFGAQWGELIFVAHSNIENSRREYAAFKADVARCGREPEHVKLTQLVNTVVAATRAEAEDKWAEIEKLPLEMTRCRSGRKPSTLISRARAWTTRLPRRNCRKCPLPGIRDHVIRVTGKEKPDGT